MWTRCYVGLKHGEPAGSNEAGNFEGNRPFEAPADDSPRDGLHSGGVDSKPCGRADDEDNGLSASARSDPSDRGDDASDDCSVVSVAAATVVPKGRPPPQCAYCSGAHASSTCMMAS